MKLLRFILSGAALALVLTLTTSAEPSKRGTFADLKGGMTDRELIRLLGAPTGIEGKSNYEIWIYPSGVVYVSPKGGVIAWKETKRIIVSENR